MPRAFADNPRETFGHSPSREEANNPNDKCLPDAICSRAHRARDMRCGAAYSPMVL
jgi:hypothetical protein